MFISARKRRFLKRGYESPEAAALGFAKDIMPQSMEEDAEYGAAIYRQEKTFGDGETLVKYDYSRPPITKHDAHKLPLLSTAFKDIPGDGDLVALIHTHGAYTDGRDLRFSRADKQGVAGFHKVPFYLVIANGDMRVFDPFHKRAEDKKYNGEFVGRWTPEEAAAAPK